MTVFRVQSRDMSVRAAGKIITYRRERTYPEYEVIVKATTLSAVTLNRVARSILRIKRPGSSRSVLKYRSMPNKQYWNCGAILYQELKYLLLQSPWPVQTEFFDTMVQAQLDYQQNSKADPVWTKRS